MSDRTEKRGGNWNDEEAQDLARRLREQAEKDRLAEEARKEKEKNEQT